MQGRNTRAGGALLALAIIGGTLIGGVLGQPSLGLVAGVAAGSLAALLLWLADRRSA